jgi:predicted PurR-regulated permease PerM
MKLPLWITVLLTAAAIAVCLPLLPWMALAVWLGMYARKFHARLAIRLGGRIGVAATLTVSLLLVVAIPIILVLTSIVLDAIALVRQLYATPESQAVLVKLVQSDPRPAGGDEAMKEISGAVDLIISQGDRAWTIGQQLAGAAAEFVIGILVMVTGIYGVLVNGGSWYDWVAKHTPLSNGLLDRFSDAFMETGRGLWFGIVGAGLIQSAIATIAYLVIGVPSALALGMLTLLLSVIPAVGTALVWAPVAAGLALTGRTGAAIALAVIGIFVISTVDNLARPWLARKGELALPTWVVLISMFGGVELIGGWGLLIGPLIVRIAKEALMIAKGEPAEHPREAATSDQPVTPAGSS